MLIVCPSCASEHTIDPAHIGPDGRRVRCAACRTTWFVAPEHSDPAGEVDPFEALMRGDTGSGMADADSYAPLTERTESASSETSRPREVKTRRRRPLEALAAAFTAIPSGLPTVALGLAAIATAILARPSIVRAAPATAALYAKIGLPVNLRGLDLLGVKSALDTTGADRLLVVEGEIVNVTGREATVPLLELVVQGDDGQALYTWTSAAPRKTLGPAERASFRARLATPPAEGRQVLVRFASASEGQTVAPEAH